MEGYSSGLDPVARSRPSEEARQVRPLRTLRLDPGTRRPRRGAAAGAEQPSYNSWRQAFGEGGGEIWRAW
jgi:hypothetical protein